MSSRSPSLSYVGGTCCEDPERARGDPETRLVKRANDDRILPVEPLSAARGGPQPHCRRLAVRQNLMATSLRILIIDDSPRDAERILRALRRAGFQPTWKRVDTAGT